jgi:hypothetical protein
MSRPAALVSPGHGPRLAAIAWRQEGAPGPGARVLSISKGRISAPCPLMLGAPFAAAGDAAQLASSEEGQAMPDG